METKKVNTIHMWNIEFSPADDWQWESHLDVINCVIAMLKMQIENDDNNNSITVYYSVTNK